MDARSFMLGLGVGFFVSLVVFWAFLSAPLSRLQDLVSWYRYEAHTALKVPVLLEKNGELLQGAFNELGMGLYWASLGLGVAGVVLVFLSRVPYGKTVSEFRKAARGG